jgi:hypothetical protein
MFGTDLHRPNSSSKPTWHTRSTAR